MINRPYLFLFQSDHKTSLAYVHGMSHQCSCSTALYYSRFIKDSEEVAKIRRTFAGLYSLDEVCLQNSILGVMHLCSFDSSILLSQDYRFSIHSIT